MGRTGDPGTVGRGVRHWDHPLAEATGSTAPGPTQVGRGSVAVRSHGQTVTSREATEMSLWVAGASEHNCVLSASLPKPSQQPPTASTIEPELSAQCGVPWDPAPGDPVSRLHCCPQQAQINPRLRRAWPQRWGDSGGSAERQLREALPLFSLSLSLSLSLTHTHTPPHTPALWASALPLPPPEALRAHTVLSPPAPGTLQVFAEPGTAGARTPLQPAAATFQSLFQQP